MSPENVQRFMENGMHQDVRTGNDRRTEDDKDQ